MYRLLFVCAGNICRSPTAEGLMKRLIEEAGLSDKIEVDSAGTSNWHADEAPDSRAVACAAAHGLDLSNLRSRPLSDKDFTSFNMILAMDEQNVWNIERKRPLNNEGCQQAQVFLLLSFSPSFGKNVPDPYYRDDGFEKVYEMLDSACRGLLLYLQKNNFV